MDLASILSKLPLAGWKAYVGGALLIGLGVYQISQGHVAEGAASIGNGLGLIGVRHAVARK
jgi:hypothetical protein